VVATFFNVNFNFGGSGKTYALGVWYSSQRQVPRDSLREGRSEVVVENNWGFR